MRNLAIIPARSGSKSIKDKNIRDICGKPLIAQTIAAYSGYFDEIMVSINSEVYAEIARQYGASVPFLRSNRTSSDKASTWEMAEEVLREYEKCGKQYDIFCVLQPTSPLRTAEDICNPYQLFEKCADFAVVSVCEAKHSPLWCGHLPENVELDNFIDQRGMKQRQAGGKYCRLNGTIYIVATERFYKDHFLYQKGSFAYIMPQSRSIDIDIEIDFKISELILGVVSWIKVFRGSSKPRYILSLDSISKKEVRIA